jgi:hypothetical protein
MVLAYLGIQHTQSDLAKELQTISGAGTPGSRIKRLSSTVLDVYYGQGELSDLESAIQVGYPPITLVYTAELPYWTIPTAHAVVVLGITGENVILNDPAIEKAAISVSIGDFHLAWDEMVNFYALLKKR